ncbi:MAG: radical SAM protein [Pseudomonadota bacterium]
MSLSIAALLPRVPVICFWEITNACNLRCIHCEADAGCVIPGELDTREASVLAADLASAGCRAVCLTGGEPLVRPDWSILARRLVDVGVAVTVITNGLLVDPPTIERMIEAGVTGVSVSLDGERDVHDAIRAASDRRAGSRYDAAVVALESLVASPLKTAVITQIHRRNLAPGSLERMHALLVTLGVDLWQLQLAMPLGRLLRFRERYVIDPEDIPALEARLANLIADGRLAIAIGDNIGYYGPHEPKLRGSQNGATRFWMGCSAGCRVVAITADGGVKGCPSHPRSFVVGNVREKNFAEIWADDSRFAYNTAWQEDLLEAGCRRCPYRRICRAGCTTMAFAVTGTVYDNPFCTQRSLCVTGDGC